MALASELRAVAEPEVLPGLGAGKVAVWWFLASEIMVFGGLIASALVVRLGGEGWHDAAAHLGVTLAAVNTLILLTSSLTVVQAFAAAARGDRWSTSLYLALTVAGGLAFLALKAVEYTTEVRAGYTPATGIFWSYYYAMTGLHALHVAAGVVVNGVFLVAGRLRTPQRVELAGLYWHFVDVVWIFLFPLLYLS